MPDAYASLFERHDVLSEQLTQREAWHNVAAPLAAEVQGRSASRGAAEFDWLQATR